MLAELIALGTKPNELKKRIAIIHGQEPKSCSRLLELASLPPLLIWLAKSGNNDINKVTY
jgi:hypothetical protein